MKFNLVFDLLRMGSMESGSSDSMILEGIVTTVDAGGQVRISPMGPTVDGEMSRLVLRPYRTSSTYRNLKRTGAGVFHVTDDVLLLAKTVVGEASAAVERAACVEGFVLEDCCRFYEFEVRQLDDSAERTTIDVEVVRSGRKRDFFGFSRGKHAVVEAAILATRTRILATDKIIQEFETFAVLVNKTGGAREREAFALLEKFVQQEAERTSATGEAVS